MKNPKNLFFGLAGTICLVAIGLRSYADVPMSPAAVPLSKTSAVADDLIGPNGTTPLNPGQAQALEKKGVDLSTLQPATSAVYAGASTVADSKVDAAIPIADGQIVDYSGTLNVAGPWQYMINVDVAQPNNTTKTMTALFSVDLHNYLARKEMLRRLGYVIPGVKYLKQLRVRYSDPITKLMKIAELSAFAIMSQDRWVVTDPTDDLNTATFQDVFVQDTAVQATRFYNLTYGPPVNTDSSGQNFLPEDHRTMRAMALVEGLLATPEDTNLMDWNACRILNGSVVLTVNDQANFGCGLDDALWILRKIAQFTRADFLQILEAAQYPEPIAQIMTEKLISRRDSLMKCFGLNVKDISFDAKRTITYLDQNHQTQAAVSSGKVVVPVYQGIATKFSGQDLQTPIKGLGWYALAELDTNALAAAFTKLDNALPGWTIQSVTAAHQADTIQTAINQFISTGQNTSVPIKVWAKPLLNGGISLSRSIQIGNYLGTNNIVQLADSASEYMNVGLYLGVDNLPANFGVSGLIQGTVNRTVTHVKPISSLKAGVTEPYKHMIADLLYKSGQNVFDSIQKIDHKLSPQEITEQITADLANLKDALGIGESLILTDSLSGIENVTASVAAINSSIGPGAALTGGGNQIVLYRLQIYRKPGVDGLGNTIQVYRDNGELSGLSLMFQATVGLPIQMPILTVTAKKVAGAATSKIFEINIDPKFDTTNPHIFDSAIEVSSLLRSRSTEFLETKMTPNIYQVKFHDSGNSIQFFHWIRRSLHEDGDITVKFPGYSPERYISLLEGAQHGKSYQALANQVATYIYQRLTNDTTITIDTQANPNPGRTFLGSSETRDGSFQGKVDDTGFGVVYPFVQVQYRWDGWKKTTDDIVKLTDSLAKKYNWQFFQSNFLGTAKDIQLYELQLNINFYQPALDALAHMSPQAEHALVMKYHAQFPVTVSNYNSAYQQFQKARLANEISQAYFNMVMNLEKMATFQDFVQYVGGSQNIYMYAVLSGYREGTEVVSNPIVSQYFGKAPDMYGGGILSYLEGVLDMNDGEFFIQYLRDFL